MRPRISSTGTFIRRVIFQDQISRIQIPVRQCFYGLPSAPAQWTRHNSGDPGAPVPVSRFQKQEKGIPSPGTPGNHTTVLHRHHPICGHGRHPRRDRDHRPRAGIPFRLRVKSYQSLAKTPDSGLEHKVQNHRLFSIPYLLVLFCQILAFSSPPYFSHSGGRPLRRPHPFPLFGCNIVKLPPELIPGILPFRKASRISSASPINPVYTSIPAFTKEK